MKTAIILSALILLGLSVAVPFTSQAAAVRTETAEEQAIKKVVAQLASQDLKFVTTPVKQVCGTKEPGTLVVVKTQIKPGVLQTIKVYGVTYEGIFVGPKVHDCSVEK